MVEASDTGFMSNNPSSSPRFSTRLAAVFADIRNGQRRLLEANRRQPSWVRNSAGRGPKS